MFLTLTRHMDEVSVCVRDDKCTHLKRSVCEMYWGGNISFLCFQHVFKRFEETVQTLKTLTSPEYRSSCSGSGSKCEPQSYLREKIISVTSHISADTVCLLVVLLIDCSLLRLCSFQKYFVCFLSGHNKEDGRGQLIITFNKSQINK